MKIYNVTVYDIDIIVPNTTTFIIRPNMASLKKLDQIMVTKTVFGAREIITRLPIITYNKDNFMSRISYRYLERHGFVFGIDEASFKHKNIASTKSLEEYKSTFLKSKFLKYIREYDIDTLDQYKVDKKIEKVKYKVK